MGDFYRDVISADARLREPKRIFDTALLEPVTRARVEAVIDEAKRAKNLELMVFETFRSRERQALLFAQKATKLKEVGVHHYGLACDLVKVVGGEPSWKGDFSFLGKLAKKHGLIWGGDWGSPGVTPGFYDGVHVQRCAVKKQASLFRGSWYPDESYDPYKD